MEKINKPWLTINSDGSVSYDCAIYFTQCTTRKVMSLYELYKIMTDLAVEDFNIKNMSREMLAQHNFAILVSRSSFKIHRMPRENEVIRATTIEEKPEPLQFVRSFEFTSVDNDGESLISGLTTWILIDVKARRILPVKKFAFTESEFQNLSIRPTTARPHDCEPPVSHIFPKDAPTPTFSAQHKIVYSDIDVNGHTNNAKYVSIMMDCLPADLQQKDFCAIKVNYAKEVMFGETLDIVGVVRDNKIAIQGKVGDVVSFEAALEYRE